MNRNSHLARSAALILLAIATCGSCEKGEVLAPAESTITLTATPNPVTFKEDDTELPVDIEARLRTKDGFPQQGVTVTFTTTGGRLEPDSITTNSDSIARVQLIVLVTDPDSIEVTATSGGVSQKVPITKKLEGVAPSDGTLTLSGPSSVSIDGASDPGMQKTVSFVALVKDKANLPLALVPVEFTASPCKFDSDSGPTDRITVNTGAAGTASTDVVIKITDYVQCSIFAQAGALTANTTIAKSVSSIPDGAYIDQSANPPQITIYVNQGQTSGSTAVSALVTVSQGGLAIPGITVLFSTTGGGQLGSTSVVTDNQGRATATLTMTTNDPSSTIINITANPITTQLTVDKNEVTTP